jgi:hypothetical protein
MATGLRSLESECRSEQLKEEFRSLEVELGKILKGKAVSVGNTAGRQGAGKLWWVVLW